MIPESGEWARADWMLLIALPRFPDQLPSRCEPSPRQGMAVKSKHRGPSAKPAFCHIVPIFFRKLTLMPLATRNEQLDSRAVLGGTFMPANKPRQGRNPHAPLAIVAVALEAGQLQTREGQRGMGGLAYICLQDTG